MARDIDMSAEDLCIGEATDPFDDVIDDVSARIDKLDIDTARQQLRLLTMIGTTQSTIIADRDAQITELRDRVHDNDHEVVELQNDLVTAESELERATERNRDLLDSLRECRADLSHERDKLRASTRIMVAEAAFMLVELLVITWLALA